MFNFSNKKVQRIVSSTIAIVLVIVMVLSCIMTTIGAF